MKNVSRGNVTHFMFSNLRGDRAIGEIVWKNVIEPDMPQMAI
jgi:hypothetical protein